MHIAVRRIPSILAPFTREYASTGCFLRHGWDGGFLDQGQALSFVEKGPATSAGREELVRKGRVYYSDEGFGVMDESDTDAEHGEEVDVVYCSVEGVNTPCWGAVDEVVARGAFTV